MKLINPNTNFAKRVIIEIQMVLIQIINGSVILNILRNVYGNSVLKRNIFTKDLNVLSFKNILIIQFLFLFFFFFEV